MGLTIEELEEEQREVYSLYREGDLIRYQLASLGIPSGIHRTGEIVLFGLDDFGVIFYVRECFNKKNIIKNDSISIHNGIAFVARKID